MAVARAHRPRRRRTISIPCSADSSARSPNPRRRAARPASASGTSRAASRSAARSTTVSHRSDTGTDYEGLQRLRNRANLQLDLDLPQRLEELRAEGWGFYDAAYAINGRSDYTEQVRDEYEWDAEVGEAWLAGGVGEHVDVAVGRQVVIWGRSESLRVLDVLNPLDNREPGRVDLEDIRRPVSMLNVKGYAGDWSAALIAIPEIRFDANPVVGSDFFPGTFELLGAAPGPLRGHRGRGRGQRDLQRLGRLVPRRVVLERRSRGSTARSCPRASSTTGSGWSAAAATTRSGAGCSSSSSPISMDWASSASSDKSRFDALLGVEYYGLTDTTFVVEVVERHLFDHERALRRAPNFTREDTQEIALRLSRNFWNDTLHATLVGIVLGWDARDGSIARFDLDYDVLDALTVGVGLLCTSRATCPRSTRGPTTTA